jgi:hypothetical protein
MKLSARILLDKENFRSDRKERSCACCGYVSKYHTHNITFGGWLCNECRIEWKVATGKC